jgi:hypothetical protein
MAETLLKRIWFSCRHQFSWPRRSESGDYYQVCLECGIRYRYDWSSMRRLGRLEEEVGAMSTQVPKKPPRKCSGQVSAGMRGEGVRSGWQPRERRLRVNTPVLFRAANGTEWVHGHTENISRSGLLFHSGKQLPAGTAIELILEMPAEISGSPGAKVICQAKVKRALSGPGNQSFRMAAAISEYNFLPAGQVADL